MAKMLHILFLILKILGIIIAIILGILVLILSILLFVPVRYEISVRCDGHLESLKVKAKITWLLHLIRGEAFYSEQCWKRRIRIAWKWLGKKQVQQEVKHKEPSQMQEEHVKALVTSHAQNVEETKKVRETQNKRTENSQKKDVKSSKIPSPKEEKSTKKTHVEKKTISEKFRNAWERVKQRIQKLGDKWKHFIEKKEVLERFLVEENHKKAFGRLKKEFTFLLKKWKPQKLNLRIRFGFEDPSITGYVLAGLAFIYPFFWGNLCVEPEFEERIFKGSIDVKGKIRFSHLVGSAIRLFMSKAVRVTYRDINEFEL